MYRVKDTQFDDRYFGGGKGIILKDKEDICEQLISYHSNDCDISVEQKLFDKGDIDSCWEALSQFEWEIEEISLEEENNILKQYIGYVTEYADEHEIKGNYPVCLYEWIDNEFAFDEKDE